MYIADLRQMRSVVQEHFGKRALFRGVQPSEGYSNFERGAVQFLAYDSFAFMFVIADEPYTSLGCVLQVTDAISTTTVLGEDLAFIENTEEDLQKALAVIDRFCRLSLPDKFLEAYDAL